MPLSSLHFLFIFLPVFLLVYYVVPRSTYRNIVLVLASLVFFAWADPVNLPLLVFTILLNFGFGLLIDNRINKKSRQAAKPYMWIAVLINLLILIFYKYTGFLLENLAGITKIAIDYEAKSLPLGVSFFTFTGVAYILDIYNRSVTAEKNLIRFSSFLVMFPKMLQGPITRFGQVKNELLQPKIAADEVMAGVRRFTGGLAKKILLADPMGVAANKVFGAEYAEIGAGVAWFGLLAYTLQIYLDFSAYTDMAIGLAKMIGIRLPENFNFPYISRSVTDFWRRWHMTLTSWFRNYLFIPLEFARKREKFLRQQSNILIVFLLTGLWHGADWNFIIWGVYFGLILAVEASGIGKLLKKLPVFLQHFYAMGAVMLGWIFFRIVDIDMWKPFGKALLGWNGWTTEISMRYLNILFYIPLALIGIAFCLPIFFNLDQKATRRGGVARLLMDIFYLGLFVLSVASILANGFFAFIYAQF